MIANQGSTSSKIIELESIRGIAALLVFLHHIPNWNNEIFGLSILRNAHLMVDLFFVLSGYVIYVSYGQKINSIKDALHFQFLRFGRLYPVHLVVLSGFFLAEIAKYFAISEYGITFGRPAFENFTFENTFANVLLVQDFGFFSNTWSINGPSWSIGIEFYIYLLFAIIGVFLPRIKLLIFTLLFLSSTIFLFTANQATYDIYSNILRGGAGFFLGCLTAACSNKLNLNNSKLSSAIQYVGIFFVIIFLLFKPPSRQFDMLIYGLSATLIITIVHGIDNPFKKFLRNRLLVELGKISYSLYMCHMLIIWTVSNSLQFVFDKFLNVSSVLKFSLAYLATFLITICISFILFNFVEQPSRLKSRKVALKLFN